MPNARRQSPTEAHSYTFGRMSIAQVGSHPLYGDPLRGSTPDTPQSELGELRDLSHPYSILIAGSRHHR